ncbi:hypothetical protein [cf. Phormidesmis sp. LEGE 11477]|uniref:hypothetical protein n=1 Tax=cf. Phormidesmis sp. LEGE 11477 TaxID=1828680 RepID=UPI001880E28D|nr:hypothetical protein [cf. Phormidesmis sp. LEGE 11477]MBE9064202.1 hypothetical protein [cf. Phormidesmis sp. LEGE 11477]
MTVGKWVVERWSAERRSLERRAVKQRAALKGDELTLWLSWTGLTWFAFLSSLLFVEVGERIDLSLGEGVIGGGLVGLAQSLVLRPYMPGAYRWLMASLISWAALMLFHIGALGWMAPATLSLPLRGGFGLLQGAYVGLGLGMGQWLAMRRQVVMAWRWVPISGMIWAVAIALGWVIGGGLRMSSGLFVSEVVGLAVAWGAIAALSGLGIVLLLRATPAEKASGTKKIDSHRKLAATKITEHSLQKP